MSIYLLQLQSASSDAMCEVARLVLVGTLAFLKVSFAQVFGFASTSIAFCLLSTGGAVAFFFCALRTNSSSSLLFPFIQLSASRSFVTTPVRCPSLVLAFVLLQNLLSLRPFPDVKLAQ
jgi:hypothetical protein